MVFHSGHCGVDNDIMVNSGHHYIMMLYFGAMLYYRNAGFRDLYLDIFGEIMMTSLDAT